MIGQIQHNSRQQGQQKDEDLSACKFTTFNNEVSTEPISKNGMCVYKCMFFGLLFKTSYGLKYSLLAVALPTHLLRPLSPATQDLD